MSKQEDCKHIIELGDRAVYVKPECPSKYAHTIKGKRVVMTEECERCRREKELTAKVEDLQKRLATTLKKLDEAEEKAEKAYVVSSVPPEPQVDIRGGVHRWLRVWGTTAKGVGKSILASLLAALDGTPDVDLEKLFGGER